MVVVASRTKTRKLNPGYFKKRQKKKFERVSDFMYDVPLLSSLKQLLSSPMIFGRSKYQYYFGSHLMEIFTKHLPKTHFFNVHIFCRS